MRSSSWIWVRNKEPRGCIGCHENGELTPENRMVDAVKKPSLNLALSPERRRTVTFAKDVSPIIRQKCATSACHGGGGPPRFGTREAVRTHVTGTARRSPLVWHLLGRNTSRPWDPPAATMRVIEQMPPEGAAPLTDIEKRIIMEWIDLGAE